MLFDFHKAQNARKLQSVHATYLVTGKKKPSVTTNGSSTKESEDISMRSSSPPFSSFPRSESVHEPEQIDVTTVTLVKEEALEAVQTEYEEIHSIFIYSLEPGPIRDLQLLSECNRKVASEYSSEDPLSAWKRYGVVQNPNAKRRTSRQPSAAAAQSSTNTISTSKSAAPKKEEAKSSLSSAKPKSSTEPLKKTESTPSLIRRESSNISSMFANAKAKPKPKPKPADSAAPTNNAGTVAEDSPMKDVSDDEGGEDDDFVMVDDGKAEVAKLARKERLDKLRAMMDDDGDEAMSDANSTARPEPADEMEQEAQAEADIDDAAALDAQPKPTDDDKREEVHVEGGRTRGKRKVMKKKTTKDEDGFLVTTEEAVWESFSEDEPDSKKVKAQSSSFGKGTKKSVKQGQGNIMNFFKKG